MAAWPTNDDLTVVIAGWPYAEFEANKKDIEGNFLKTYDLVPSFAERLRAGTRETRFVGTAVPNFFRKPYGPGWALVGDAGYFKDPLTTHGMTDALRDAELLADQILETLTGVLPEAVALARYQAKRDQLSARLFEATEAVASYAWGIDQVRTLLRQVSSAMSDEVDHLRVLPDRRPALAGLEALRCDG